MSSLLNPYKIPIPAPLKPRPRPNPNGNPRSDSPTLGNPPQSQATDSKLETNHFFPRPPLVTNDPKPRPRPQFVNAPSMRVGDPIGNGGECADMEQGHVILFEDHGHRENEMQGESGFQMDSKLAGMEVVQGRAPDKEDDKIVNGK